MRQAVRQTVILWVSLLLVGGLALFILLLPASRQWMWQQTGEEAFLSQVKGLSDLGADLLRPRLDFAPDAAISYANLSPFGVNVFLEQEADPAKRALAMEMTAGAGFRWLRQEFPWEDIEIHGKGDFEDRRHEPFRSAWEKYDHIVALAEQNELQLIVRLSNPPTWTRALGDEAGPYAPPDYDGDFADFVASVVGRYKGRVRYYQLWNEPNLTREWRADQPINPEAYAELLKSAAQAARAADPDVVLILGALSATIDLDGTTLPGRSFNDLIYLQRLYDAGAAPYFDIVAMQGYGLFSGPTDSRMPPARDEH